MNPLKLAKKPFVKLLDIALVVPKTVLGSDRSSRREARDQMGAMNAERSAITAERASRESELSSKRNRLALGMARARRNRGGFGFGAQSQPNANGVKSTLG